jgi:hypothetical protein
MKLAAGKGRGEELSFLERLRGAHSNPCYSIAL